MCNEENALVMNDDVVKALLNDGFSLDGEDVDNTYFSRGVLSVLYTEPAKDDERELHRIHVETSTEDLEEWETASLSVYFNRQEGLKNTIERINNMR